MRQRYGVFIARLAIGNAKFFEVFCYWILQLANCDESFEENEMKIPEIVLMEAL
jgi:hypothetical protein